MLGSVIVGIFLLGTCQGESQGKSANVTHKIEICGKRLIGYYTSWSTKPFTPEQAKKLTHVIFAFLTVQADGRLTVGNPAKRGNTGQAARRLDNILKIRQKYAPNLKVFFAVGGWENSEYFSSIVKSRSKRQKFYFSTVTAFRRFGFDGIDIDWEHPVNGGKTPGHPDDRKNYVSFMKELRRFLDQYQQKLKRPTRYQISFAGAAGLWGLSSGYDLPKLLKYADWVNVMSYDYFGPWKSKWGQFTGPPAPLFFGAPEKYSGKLNVDWTMKYYVCKTLMPEKVNLGIPFYGRYWLNVGRPIKESDGMWRKANQTPAGTYEGGVATWKEITNKWLRNKAFTYNFHDKVKAPYAWNEQSKIFLGFENSDSVLNKIQYAMDKNFGGIMMWSIDQDDDRVSLLNIISTGFICQPPQIDPIRYKCSPISDKRWWTMVDGEDKAGLCGRSAPLINGYYPVCDPDDPGYSCCGAFGYCGSGRKYCDCPVCINYGANPQKILEEPIRPAYPTIWYSQNAPSDRRGRCGRNFPKIGGQYPICNPDDRNAHCCSPAGYCGNSEHHCLCPGCTDFAKTPSYRFSKKLWWSWNDGADKSGRCGSLAPKIDGETPICDPDSGNAYCCSSAGWCGSGPQFCTCNGCTDYRTQSS